MNAINVSAVLIIIAVGIIAYAAALLFRDSIRVKPSHGMNTRKQWLKAGISDSLEKSEPIHLNIGIQNDSDLNSGAGLTAMTGVENVSAQMAFADEPWRISCGSAGVAFFEKDAVKIGLDNADYGNDFEEDCTRYCGFSPVLHQAASISMNEGKPVALHMNLGTFGSSAVIQDLAYAPDERIFIAGDDLASQAVGLITADQVMIGEEQTEISGYMSGDSETDPSLLTMDILRFSVLTVLIVTALIEIFGKTGL